LFEVLYNNDDLFFSEKTPTEVTLHGTQYLMYNLVRNDSDDIYQSTRDKIDLYFRTQQPNGLIFFIGKQLYILYTCRNKAY